MKTKRRKASKYMLKLYRDSFDGEVCEFWTDEDGMLMSLVTLESSGWENRIAEHYAFKKGNVFTPTKIKRRFAYRSYFNGRKQWQTQEEPTEFPVIEYELEVPL